MTSPTKLTVGSAYAHTAAGNVRAADVYTVGPGSHVSFPAGAAHAATPFDLIEVVAAHGTAQKRASRPPVVSESAEVMRAGVRFSRFRRRRLAATLRLSAPPRPRRARRVRG
jgi:hypothetical protein